VASSGARPDRAAGGVFVTGTGTEVGKTVVAGVIARAAVGDGLDVAVFKPAVSGLDECAERGEPADHERLRHAARSDQSDEQIAPYRYGPAVAPHLAAELAGEEISPSRLHAGARAAVAGRDYLVCEGVGGFLVPLTSDYLVRDFARDLALPVVVAAEPGLGTINHTLLTVEAVRGADLEVLAVVLTPWPERPGELERSNRETIGRLAGVSVLELESIALDRPGDWPQLAL